MIAASSVETEGNNKPFLPPKCFQSCPQNILLGFHRHELKMGKTKETRMKEKSVQIHRKV